jgi:polyisoprenoid-binding protein YceI
MTSVPESATVPASATEATRVVDGVRLPVAGVWRIDPGHAEVAFVGRHFMVTRVRGRFTGVAGAIVVAEDPAASSVSVEIQMDTVDSGDRTRDDHLRSGDLFEVATYPTATFRSTSVSWRGTSGTVSGELTIKGVTRRVDLAARFQGQVRDPWGAERAIFSARTTINREDFGVTWNMVLETGGLLVSKEISIELELEAILQA